MLSPRRSLSNPPEHGLMRLLLPACCCFLLAGCGLPFPQTGGSPEGPGRLAHAAIHRTSAPWDGAAVRLILAEKPVTGKAPAAPFLSVRINRATSELLNQSIRLGPKESRT